jgi:hypothetical protein
VVTFDPTSPGTPTGVDLNQFSVLVSVSCAGLNLCVAAEYDGKVVTFDPLSPGGSLTAEIDPGRALGAVACRPTGQCTAVDSIGHEVTWLNEGVVETGPEGGEKIAEGGGTTTTGTTATGTGSVTKSTSSPAATTTSSAGHAMVHGATVSGDSLTVEATCSGPSSSVCVLFFQLSGSVAAGEHGVAAVSAHAHSGKPTRKTVILGRAVITLHGGQSQKVEVKLNSAGMRLLKKLHRLPAKLVTTENSVPVASSIVTFKAHARTPHR